MGMLANEDDQLPMLYPNSAEAELRAYLQQQQQQQPMAAQAQAPAMDPALQFAQRYRQMLQQSGMLPTASMPQPSEEDIRQAKIARDMASFRQVADAMAGRAISDPNAAYNEALRNRMASNPAAMEYARQAEQAKAMREMTSPDLISFMAHLSTSKQPMSLGDFMAAQRTPPQAGAAQKDLEFLAAVRAGQVPGVTEEDYLARQASRGGAGASMPAPVGAPQRLANGNLGVVVWNPQTGQQEVRDTGAAFYEEPSATVQTLAAKAWDAQTAAAGQSNRAADIEARIAAVPDDEWRAGIAGQLEESVRKKLGVEDLQSVLSAEYRTLSLSGALKNLPPGPATDRDVQLVLEGTIPPMANKQATMAFLRGLRKVAAIEADRQRFTGEYISANPQRGILGLPQAWSEYASQQKGWLPESKNAPATPGATMRWNPETRRLEPVQ
jgi:hypothetical protein